MPKKPSSQTCPWALGSAAMLAYHDTEWGVPLRDDGKLFEFLILEGAQAGLNWSTILNRREGYRAVFDAFAPEKIAGYGARKVASLLRDERIIRNRLKVASTVTNARAFLAVQKEFGTFSEWMWSFVGGKPIQNKIQADAKVPATSPESDAFSKALKKRGFTFVGSTIIYAHMQATGMVNDHLVGCPRHRVCAALGAKLR
jgi:DNA-3-methyladenine glycosylase I